MSATASQQNLLTQLGKRSVKINQISPIYRCENCDERIDDEDERACHVCSQENIDPMEDDTDEGTDGNTNKKDLLCPLGCPPTRRFDRPEMEEHLREAIQ